VHPELLSAMTHHIAGKLHFFQLLGGGKFGHVKANDSYSGIPKKRGSRNFIFISAAHASFINVFKLSIFFFVLSGLTFRNSVFCQQSVFMCFVGTSEQRVAFALYSIK
jgi:hypothetical protein